MPYSNPVVLSNMFRATENRTNPMETAAGKQRLRLMDQFKERQMQMQEQDSRTAMQEGYRKLMKSVHDMKKDDREALRNKIADRTSGDLYAKEAGPEAWDRRMKDTNRNIPFEEADRALAPGIGMGKVFENYQKYEDRKAEERKSKRTTSYKPTQLQTDSKYIADNTKMNLEQAIELLTYAKAMPPEQTINRIMIDLAKSDEGKGMTKQERLTEARNVMSVIQQLQAEQANPQDPLGLMK